VEAAPGGADGGAHVLGARIRCHTERLLRGGVDGGERPRAAGDELAVDEQTAFAIGQDCHPTSCIWFLDNCPTEFLRTIAADLGARQGLGAFTAALPTVNCYFDLLLACGPHVPITWTCVQRCCCPAHRRAGEPAT